MPVAEDGALVVGPYPAEDSLPSPRPEEEAPYEAPDAADDHLDLSTSSSHVSLQIEGLSQ